MAVEQPFHVVVEQRCHLRQAGECRPPCALLPHCASRAVTMEIPYRNSAWSQDAGFHTDRRSAMGELARLWAPSARSSATGGCLPCICQTKAS